MSGFWLSWRRPADPRGQMVHPSQGITNPFLLRLPSQGLEIYATELGTPHGRVTKGHSVCSARTLLTAGSDTAVGMRASRLACTGSRMRILQTISSHLGHTRSTECADERESGSSVVGYIETSQLDLWCVFRIWCGEFSLSAVFKPSIFK